MIEHHDVWVVTTYGTGDGIEPTTDVCRSLERAKEFALELLDYPVEEGDEDEMAPSRELVRKWDGFEGMIEVDYFDGNTGKLLIQQARVR